MSGGDVEADTRNIRPGGILGARSLGGPSKRTDVTVKHLYDVGHGSNSFHFFIKQLDDVCGFASMTVSYTPLDADGNPNRNKTVAYTGTLKSVQHPTFDLNSTNPATLTLVMDADMPSAETYDPTIP